MAPIFASAAAMMMAVALQLLAVAAAAPAPIGLPNCSTTCGDVSVPYPFGISAGCYMPGFNLTCDTSHHPPRLLLGDGTLRVAEISLRNGSGTIRVIRRGFIINTTEDLPSRGLHVPFGRGFREYGYLLSDRNELVASGCNVVATLHTDLKDGARANKTQTVSGCATFCPKIVRADGRTTVMMLGVPSSTGKDEPRCSGASGDFSYCKKPLCRTGRPDAVQAKWIDGGIHDVELYDVVSVFVAEEGWVDKNGLPFADQFVEAPLILEWEIVVKGQQPQGGECSADVRSILCKSKHSSCSVQIEGYACSCDHGYDGNP